MKKELTLYVKQYDGEPLYDVQRDIIECFDGVFNEIAKSIPQDEHGFKTGTFTVTVTWSDEE